MAQLKGEGLKVGFDSSLRLEFHGSKVVRHSRYISFQIGRGSVANRSGAEIRARKCATCATSGEGDVP